RSVPDVAVDLLVQFRVIPGFELGNHAFLALGKVVFGELHDSTGQQHNGNQVDGGHQPHGRVSGVKDGNHSLITTPDHHAQSGKAQNREAKGVAALEVNQCVLGVGVVGDDGGKGEEQNGDGNKVATEVAQMHFHGLLGQLRACDTRARFQNACQQDHHRCGGTDDDGIDKHAKRLDQAL